MRSAPSSALCAPTHRTSTWRLIHACVALLLLLASTAVLPSQALAQEEDEDGVGAWYMFFWNTTFADGPWGLQGDVQYRNWNTAGDLEQLLLRAGFTYTPEDSGVTLTLGGAHITIGESGDSDETISERRVYQEALLRQPIASWLLLRHRYRFEQRWVDDQDFRTRFRYALFADVPLNGRGTGEGAFYIALYNELFINGQLDIGDDRQVQRFDQNRLYGGLGWGATSWMKLQGGYMIQTLNPTTKDQLQLSAHVSF